ncbi:tryptophan 2,3-dioxygenase family protein [Streptomyces sp. DH12]|uniref:tryptophan 2,3-dioxygenase family protein n=1 Tax=Streptomyces sp. DH12 TaxID=2857010 RepID=UPI001E455710|nr:tryptophan 2,3-dioxygenase family protein [Streptomyces sp. DH12]
MDTPYERYLRLPALLSLQDPRTPRDGRERWADEHFFIVVHQSAELLVRQALIDLGTALEHAGAHRVPETCSSLRRVTALVEALDRHLALLDHLDPADFADFRPLLEGASGAQSPQFATLFELVEEHGGAFFRHGPDTGGAAGTSTAPGEEPRGSEDPREPASSWRALHNAVTRWRVRHLLMVERMIGEEAGTGGTTGLEYLRARIDLPPRRPSA